MHTKNTIPINFHLVYAIFTLQQIKSIKSSGLSKNKERGDCEPPQNGEDNEDAK